MGKIFCDLDCSKLSETFCFQAIDEFKRKITFRMHEARDNTKAADVLQLHIKKMQGILLQHVWSELLCLKQCKIEIVLEDLADESSLIFVLANILKSPTPVVINEVNIIKINSLFPNQAKELLDLYCRELKAANVNTSIFTDKSAFDLYQSQKETVAAVIKQGIFNLSNVSSAAVSDQPVVQAALTYAN